MSLGDIEPTTSTGQSTAKVFISYSRRDVNFADRIDAALKGRGFDTLIDRSEIYALEDWWERIETLIAQADTIVFILSPDAVASDICQSEVRFAASLNKRLAPIVYCRVDDRSVPAELARLNFIFFDDPARFDENLNLLAEALVTDIEWVRQHTEFGEHARRWMIAGRPGPRGLLLRPPALDEAERWIASRPSSAPLPTEITQAFIAESRQAHTRRRNTISCGLAAGLLVALGLAGYAYLQRNEAVSAARRLAETEADNRAALAQQLASAGRVQLAAAIALDAAPRDKNDTKPLTPALAVAIDRTLDQTKVPVERFVGENVWKLAISPDGRTVAAGTVKGVVHVLDAVTLAERYHFTAGKDVVSGLSFSPDGTRILAAGDKIPNVWNAATGEKLFDLDRSEATKFAKSARFSSDGMRIVVGTAENRALLYEAATGTLLRTLPGADFEKMTARLLKQREDRSTEWRVTDPIVQAVAEAQWKIWGAATDAAFSPDGKLVAVTGPATPDGSVLLYDAATGTLARTLSGGYGTMLTPPMNYGQTLWFSPDGGSVIAAPLEKTIKVWNVADGALRADLSARGITSFVLTADGEAVVSAHENGSLIVRCLAGNGSLVSVQAHDASIGTLTTGPWSDLLATGSEDRSARIWQMPKGADVCDVDAPGNTEYDRLGLRRPIANFSADGIGIANAMVFSPDERYLFTASRDGWVRSWPIAPSDAVDVGPVLADSTVVLSGDGRALFTLSDNESKAWDTLSGKPVKLPKHAFRAVAPGSPGHAAILFPKPDTRFRLGDPVTKNADGPFDDWTGPVSPDGARVVAAGTSQDGKGDADAKGDVWLYQRMALFDSGTQTEIAPLTIPGRRVSGFLFSRDGSRLFAHFEDPARTGTDVQRKVGGIAVWKAGTGKLLTSSDAIEGFTADAKTLLSDSGQRLLLRDGNNVGAFKIDATGITPVALRALHGADATAVTLSADGAHVIAGRVDGTIELIDAEHNRLERVFDTRGIRVERVAMSPDGHYLAAVDQANTLWLFDAGTGYLVRSQTLAFAPSEIRFFDASDRLLLIGPERIVILRVTPAIDGATDATGAIEVARKAGLNLVSEEDQRRYQIAVPPVGITDAEHRWAALDPNSEGTAPIVWDAGEAEARAAAAAACKEVSKTCSSRGTATDDLDGVFVLVCCTTPRRSCVANVGSAESSLLSVKRTLSAEGFSGCIVESVARARDGTAW